MTRVTLAVVALPFVPFFDFALQHLQTRNVLLRRIGSCSVHALLGKILNYRSRRVLPFRN